jgi:hypothetical protein
MTVCLPLRRKSLHESLLFCGQRLERLDFMDEAYFLA